jgi:hypothetical protein
MVRRSTWILLAIFGLLVGFAWLFQRDQRLKVENKPTGTPVAESANLFNLTGAQVDFVNFSDSSGRIIEFSRNSETGQWTITGVLEDQVDSPEIGSNLAQLFAIKAQEILYQAPPLDSIGLAFPVYHISMTTASGKLIVLDVGTVTPVGKGYYVRVDSGPVVIVDKVMLEVILDTLSNPPLTVTTSPEIINPDTVFPSDSGIQITSTP